MPVVLSLPYSQLRANVLKWLVFHLCLWRKSYFMKRGIKHDKVSCRQ